MLPWLALGAFVLAALAVDLLLGSSGTPSVRRALVWSVVWTLVGAGVRRACCSRSTAAPPPRSTSPAS